MFSLIGFETVQEKLREEHKGLSLILTGRVNMTCEGDICFSLENEYRAFLQFTLLITSFFRTPRYDLSEITLNCAAILISDKTMIHLTVFDVLWVFLHFPP